MIQYQRVYIYLKEFAPYSYCTLISVLTQGMQHYSSDAWIMGHRERGQRSDSHPADTPYNTCETPEGSSESTWAGRRPPAQRP